MSDNLERRRKRAYSILCEMPHNILKTEAVRILGDAGCYDLDPHIERQYGDFIKGFHKACRQNHDVQLDMIPLWRLVPKEDGTFAKEHYLGRFGEMTLDQHQQHLSERLNGIKGDVNSFYYYFDALDARKRSVIQRHFHWIPSRPPEPADDDED